MAATSQERLFELLMERVSTDRYPSHHLLDRIEGAVWTSEQAVAYALHEGERPPAGMQPSMHPLLYF